MSNRLDSQDSLMDEVIQKVARDQIRATYIPISVYRLQFSPKFTFSKATQIIPYLANLGIGAVYCSPYFESFLGSDHGYDIVNPNALNPEVGSLSEYETFCKTLQQYHLGHIVDIVPNHMGILGTKNKWWMDVLENGRDSLHSEFFDIDWESEKKELHNKVLLPILGDFYGNILKDQQLKLLYNSASGSFFVQYWEHQLPLSPESYVSILEYGVQQLQYAFSDSDRDYLELLSIIKAFKALPSGERGGRRKKLERNREKEMAKDRIKKLGQKSEQIERFIQSRVEIYNAASGEFKGVDLLHNLLDQQHYRVSYWRVASEEINYRRFFDVNALAAIRIEDPETFDAYHKFLFKLLSSGKIQGLRIDHADGLYDPTGYLTKVQKTYLTQKVFNLICASHNQNLNSEEKKQDLLNRIEHHLKSTEFDSAKALYIVVEKILERKELLPQNWSVHGTVGYEFLNSLNGLFIRSENKNIFSEIYETFIKQKIDFEELVYQKKKFYALVNASGEINALGHLLDSISETNPHFRDYTVNNLTLAIREIIASFPVYRTYIRSEDAVVSRVDEKYIHIAIEKARQKTPALNPVIYDFLEMVLTLRFDANVGEDEKKRYKDFVLRFQQMTGPVMAKGLEDTAFYIFNRLVSLNEVGGDPLRFGNTVSEFHNQNINTSRHWPNAFITSMTHDVKRSEDVRLRINVLSELPKVWKTHLWRWAIMNKKHKTLLGKESIPERNTEYFIYQTLLGLWPDHANISSEESAALIERAWTVVLKSVRESKTHTQWMNPNEDYENALRHFLTKILDQESPDLFLKDFHELNTLTRSLGMLNSISASVLRLSSPGVPDIYQGSEAIDDRFVDPDNRQPIQFEDKIHALKTLQSHQKSLSPIECMDLLFRTRESGLLKLHLTQRALLLRRAQPEFFQTARYIPLVVEGKKSQHCIAFMLKSEKRVVIVLAGRFFYEMMEKNRGHVLGDLAWRGTWIILPKRLRNNSMVFTDLYTQETIRLQRDKKREYAIPVGKVLKRCTATILTGFDPQISHGPNVE